MVRVVCAHCGSPEVMASLDEYVCLECGGLTLFDGSATQQMTVDTREIPALVNTDEPGDPDRRIRPGDAVPATPIAGATTTQTLGV